MKLNVFRRKSFAIDLGNTNTIVSDKDGVKFSQPSCIVFDKKGQTVKAIGNKAYSMFEKNHEELRTVRPLKGGVIADYDSATRMIREMLKEVDNHKSFLGGYDHILSSVPYYTTEVERRALRDAVDQFNARKTSLFYEPLAAALGIGLDIREPEGKMLIDIGGGITEIVVISLSGVASVQSTKIAGDSFDEAIQDHFRRNYNMAIGMKTAEQVKIKVGAVISQLRDQPAPMMVKGKDLVEGIPVTRKIDHHEVAFVLEKSFSSIENCILQTLETCPPELAADIYLNGIHVTGGNALIRGIKERLEAKVKLPVHIDEDALISVSKGAAQILRDPVKYRGILFD